MKDISQWEGCLVGGAIGDALGAPIEFQSLTSIRSQYGPQGVIGFVDLNEQGVAEFTDDTQMTLFTAEGLLVGLAQPAGFVMKTVTATIFNSYQRWLVTQKVADHKDRKGKDGGLLSNTGLWKRKAPGVTCLSALERGEMGQLNHPINQSKGCGGVMRVAPIGLAMKPDEAFTLGCAAAAITHSHPSGYLSAGCLAHMIAVILSGKTLLEAVDSAIRVVQKSLDHHETLTALQLAVQMAFDRNCPASPETVEKMGQGWVAEEALAISVYCALIGADQNNFRKGVLLAINHSGDSDSTGAICGNLLGTLLGIQAIPAEWIDKIEMRSVLMGMAADLFSAKWIGTNRE